MAGSTSIYPLSPAHILLLAVNFASTPDLESLTALKNLHPRVLTPQKTLTVLLFLPESLHPSVYIPLLDSILNDVESHANSPKNDTHEARSKVEVDTSAVSELSEKAAQHRLDRLLETVPKFNAQEHAGEAEQQNLVAAWLLSRSKNIDTETGMLSLVETLLTPFIGRLPTVKAYFNGTVKVLSRLIYEHHHTGDGLPIGEESEREEPGNITSVVAGSLTQFEALPSTIGVKQLLSKTSQRTVVRDLEILAIPYLRYRERDAKLDGWKVVWEWLVSQGIRTNYEVYMNWDGPQGCGEEEEALMAQYASTGMAACYLCREIGPEIWDMMKKIQGRIVEVLGLRQFHTGIISAKFNKEVYLRSLTPKPTLTDFLSTRNALIIPNLESLDLLGYLIASAGMLSLPLYSAAQIRLSGTKEEQRTVLVRFVRNGNWMKRTDPEWKHVIEATRWMRSPAGIFEQLTEEECEEILARGLLSASKFKIMEDIYVKNPVSRPLGLQKLEKIVLEAFQEFYDNASNGNKTRGGMKNAQLVLQILYPSYSTSLALTRASRLLNATHALSFYSLTLTPGVPLLPVQIRINSDPVSLLGRLLDQNASLYHQLNKLVPLAKDLYFGTAQVKPRTPTEQQNEEEEVERRVLGMCIETALAEDDFDTAYSLTKSRLKTPEGKAAPSKDVDGGQHDESAWKACFQAGRYRSHRLPQRDDDALKRLEMQMELLAEALRTCPAVACNQVLSEWMRKESEMASVLLREAEEDEAHAAAAHRVLSANSNIIGGLPGGWGSNTSLLASTVPKNTQEIKIPSTTVGESEAPMGLFAVAAGAAKALGSSVRPPGVPRSSGSQPGVNVISRPQEAAFLSPSLPPNMGGSPPQKQRKRDIVGGMVTSGLASSIGWVLGAQPNAGGK
ncbi:secretory pathway protein Sec39-domain-containing protein [Kalaharituber pfeilii]|nr:secretory pathway protein Sec39-domain-containing protein [Kalaharituber pfeilii]